MDIKALGKLSPLNEFDRAIVVESINTSTGTKAPVTTGTVTGFLATSFDPEATTAHASLSVSGVYIGGQLKVTGETATYAAGTWLFHIDASVLTVALLDGLFLTTTPYFHVSKVDSNRLVFSLDYCRTATGTLG